MKRVEYKLAGMGRHKDVERRRALLEGCCAYAEERGLFGLTLRPLAERLETSTRNLLHHFGSRENLIAEIVDRTLVTHLAASRELLLRIRDLSVDESSPSVTAAHVTSVISQGLEMAWVDAHTPGGRRRTAMFFEIYTAATRDPELQQTFLVPVVTEWLDPMAAAIEAAGASPGAARSVASRILAAHRGLLLEDLALGCNVATDAAHRDAVLTVRAEIFRATSSDLHEVHDAAK